MSITILRPYRIVLAALLLGAVFVACNNQSSPQSTGGAMPEGDPMAGYVYLLTGAFGTSSGLTTTGATSIDTIWTVWPEPLRSEAANATRAERRRMTYDRYGLLQGPGPDSIPGRSLNIPLNFTPVQDTTVSKDSQDTTVVTKLYVNCLLCHAGRVNNTVMPGINNTHVALQTLTNDVAILSLNILKAKIEDAIDKGITGITGDLPDPTPGNMPEYAFIYEQVKAEAKHRNIELDPLPGGLQSELHRALEGLLGFADKELDKFLDELEVLIFTFVTETPQDRQAQLDSLLGDTIGNLVAKFLAHKLPVYSNSDGTTNAFYVAAQEATMRDLQANLHKLPQRPLPPLDQWATETPAWYNSKHKKLFYRDGFIEDSPQDLMQFTMSPNNSGDSIRSWYPDFVNLRAWILWLEPPAYPFDIDEDLAQRGRLVFTNNCAECHGFYGAGGGSFVEGWHDQDIVKTDSTRLVGMGTIFREYLRDSFFGEDGTGPGGRSITVLKPPGYIAPPLNGIWASAPYFHNGSAPTIWDVLKYDERPPVWLRSRDGYDQEKLGLLVERFETLPPNVTEPSDVRRYYQNTLVGKGNSGHEFPLLPQKLTDEEITALIEYLKTL